MKPSELLEEVTGQFVVLYHKDPVALTRLLRQSLGKYQDKAGVLLRTQVDAAGSGPVPLPPHFLSLAVAVDANAAFVPSFEADGGIILGGDAATVYPVTLHYYANLREWPEDVDLPACCVSLVMEYLKALIDIPNTERARGAYAQLGQQVELPSGQELREVVMTLELAMEDAKALPVPVAVF